MQMMFFLNTIGAKIRNAREILIFLGIERGGGSEAFYPGFFSGGAIRQSQRTLGLLI